MKYITKYWLLALAVFFLVFKIVGIVWSTIDFRIDSGGLPIHIRNMGIIEIMALTISLAGLFIKTRTGFALSLLYSFVALEYGIIYDLIISKNAIGNTFPETIASMGVGIIVFTLIVFNQRKKEELNTRDIRIGMLYSSLLSLPIMLFLAYGYMLLGNT